MSCKYYFWDGHYACMKKREGDRRVDDDWYYKYCRNYDYDDCPIYKGDSGSSGACFLTSACTEAKGLPDDCDELTTLRRFRDSYLKNRDNGEADIKEYYEKAPIIVSAIKARENSQELFERIYEELVLPCVKMIKGGDHEGAYKTYKEYVIGLERQYIS